METVAAGGSKIPTNFVGFDESEPIYCALNLHVCMNLRSSHGG